MEAKTPVVIVGGSLNSLGVIRSLAPHGMPIVVMETTPLCPARWSRYAKFVLIEKLEGRPLIEALKKQARILAPRPVLILTDDRAVSTVSDHRQEILPHFRIDLPDAEMLRQLMDKTLFQTLAEREKMDVPRSAILENENSLGLLESLQFPLVLKPGSKSSVLNGEVDRAMKAENLTQARAVASQMLARTSRVIAQEWIEGPDTEIFFTLFVCNRQSEVAAIFSGRKILCDPPLVGSTAVCVRAPQEARTLEMLTERFIKTVNYRGIGSLEFKRDSRSRKFVIVEPTVGRTDWQEEIATLCGVNIPLTAYQVALGLTETPEKNLTPPPSFAWRSARRHKPPPGELSPGTRMRGGYFLFRDPLPAIYYYTVERLAARAWNLAKKLGDSFR